MRIYNDPIYGQIELEDLIFDLIQKCPELKRLKYIGMMNFKSIGMLPLTSITRLEHTIGLAYLAQIFSVANSLQPDFSKDLIIASLYHDVNCGSFGHAIEWAIDRYTPFNHEKATEWISSSDRHPFFASLPWFLDMPGLHTYDFGNKYNPNFKRIYQLIKGVDTFAINNKGIDLDNIDNVFRMAFYLGIAPEDKTIALTLVKNLKMAPRKDNFVIDEKDFYLINIWYKLRSDVYFKFIYSKEYMGFEFLIFQLIYEYSKHVDKDDIGNLFHLTDENLLWNCLTDKKKYPDAVQNIARKLLLHELPKVCSIIRADDTGQKEALTRESLLKSIAVEVKDYLLNKKYISDSTSFNIYFHVTTDNRKTSRKVDIYVDNGGTIVNNVVGEDKSFLLLSILSTVELSEKIITTMTDKTIEVLNANNLGKFELVQFSDDYIHKQGDLFKT